ncbi:MAG TPA: (2Fe-2S)-binding protein [Terriglobales bacterium]|nr:(2Fe-2S)-binding protein [Terriglobales bacterium]
MKALLLTVNGKETRVDAHAEDSLLEVLRENLQLTGTKYGCGEGQCGACTVLLDGKPVRSCKTPASFAVGKKITTIEGLEQNGRLHPVQEAFLQEAAFQCGYCTSGMIVSAVGLLASNANPSDDEIIRYMNGNICRCGTYPRIISAVRLAVQSMRRG